MTTSDARRDASPRTPRPWALGLCAAILFAAAPLSAQTASVTVPPDVLVLRDGTMFRGTLVERGAERVVLLLATGETRTFASADVESVAPDSEAVPAATPHVDAATAVPEPPSVRLHVRSHQTARALWGAALSRGGPHELLCAPPCDIVLEAGVYDLAVSEGIGSPDRAGGPLELPAGEAWLDIEHVERKDQRAAGYALTLTFGLALGGFAVPAFMQPDEVWLWVAVGASAVLAITGLVLSFLQETSEARLRTPTAAERGDEDD